MLQRRRPLLNALTRTNNNHLKTRDAAMNGMRRRIAGKTPAEIREMSKDAMKEPVTQDDFLQASVFGAGIGLPVHNNKACYLVVLALLSPSAGHNLPVIFCANQPCRPLPRSTPVWVRRTSCATSAGSRSTAACEAEATHFRVAGTFGWGVLCRPPTAGVWRPGRCVFALLLPPPLPLLFAPNLPAPYPQPLVVISLPVPDRQLSTQQLSTQEAATDHLCTRGGGRPRGHTTFAHPAAVITPGQAPCPARRQLLPKDSVNPSLDVLGYSWGAGWELQRLAVGANHRVSRWSAPSAGARAAPL